MISSLYAAMLALLIVWLSLRVIKLRREKKVRLGDGGEPELQAASEPREMQQNISPFLSYCSFCLS